MAEPASTETFIETAINRLTIDIVSGALPPGQKLMIADLKLRYGIGASPMREALAKLSSLGFVVFDSRRGFRVAAISRADLEDITHLRQVLECEALRGCLKTGDGEWEVGIIAATARLDRRAARCRGGELSAPDDLERAHKQFHTALLAAANSPRLIALHSLLYDQAQRYRAVMMQHARELDDFVETHERLARAVLTRDPEIACAELSRHLALTLQTVYPDQPHAPAKKGAGKTRRSVARQ